MATGKVIGKIESTKGDVTIVAADGSIREAKAGEMIFEGEQIVSNDSTAEVEVKYLALGEATTYQGVFNVLADNSVVAEADGSENKLTKEEILALVNSEEATAAGEESVADSGRIIDDSALASSHVQGFFRGDNGEFGSGITQFSVSNGDDQTPPIILSSNVVVYDEANGLQRADGDVVIQVNSADTSAVSYSLVDGLDSEFFVIDSQNGNLKFITQPDFENPQDSDGDNEYNVEVKVTDALGNFSTQLISVSINNINDNTPLSEDATTQLGEDSVDGISGQLVGGDADGNGFTYVLVDDVTSGILNFHDDGSYNYNPSNAFESLGEGETTTVTFTYKTVEVGTDPILESPISTVTITVTGTNDAPTAVVDSDTVDEDGTLIVDVLANDTDPDATAVLSLDTVSVDKGAVSVTDDNKLFFDTNGEFDHLAVGQSETVVVTYSMSDEHGATSTSTATIEVTGTNDAPVAHEDTAITTENASVLINVLANDTDVDDDASFTLVDASTSGGGSVSVVGNQLQFNPSTFFDFLQAGEQTTVTIDYTMQDNHNAQSSSTVTLTIIGTNDVPVVTGDFAGGTIEDITDIAVGKIDVTDLDARQSFVQSQTSTEGDFGTFSVTAAGDWLYDLNNDLDAVQSLAKDATITDSFDVLSLDGTVIETVTVTITGTNDKPVVAAEDDFGAIEDYQVVEGQVSASDVDAENDASNLIYSLDGDAPVGLTFNADGSYSFDPAQDAYQDLAYNETRDVTFTWFVTDAQGETSNSDSVTITIVGTNDRPVVENINESDNENSSSEVGVNEDANTFSGVLVAADVDTNDTHSFAVVEGSVNVVSDVIIDTNDGVVTLDDVAVSITQNSEGAWIYTIDSAFDALADGEHATVTFQYTADDGLGFDGTDGMNEASVSEPALVTLVITGTNDQPEVTSMTVTDFATETDGVTTFDGQLATVIDVDANDTHSYELIANSSSADETYISDFGVVVDANGDFHVTGNFDGLALGQETVIKFEYKAVDNSTSQANGESNTANPQLVELTIVGTNDQPEINKVRITDASEVEGNGETTIDGSLATATDVDVNDANDITYQLVDDSVKVRTPNNDNHNWTSDDAKELISISNVAVNEDGSFSLTGDFNALADGEVVKVVFKYTADDNQGADNSLSDVNRVVLLVTGTNDAPIVEDVTLTDTDEADSGLNTFIGNLVETDLDVSDTHTFELVGNADSSMDEYDDSLSVTVNADGSYSLSGDFNTLAVGESTTVTFDYKATDDSGTTTDTSTVETVSVTITGTNDGPVAVNDGGLANFDGNYYGSSTAIHGLADAQSIADNEAPDASFVATVIDYTQGSGNLGYGEHLENFLAQDAASLSDHPQDNDSRSVITLEGDLDFAEGDYTFKVYSDDGYQILVDGEVAGEFTGNRGPSSNTNPSIHIDGGEHHIEMIYWDQGGQYVLNVEYAFNNGDFVTLDTTNIISTNENDAISIDVLANDTDIDHGAHLTLVSVDDNPNGDPLHVSVADNELLFTPGTDFDYLAVGESVDVVVTYVIKDENNATATATATLTVVGTNDQPIVNNVNVNTGMYTTIDEETTGVNTISGDLASEVSDVDSSDTHTFYLVSDATSTNGLVTGLSASVDSDGTFSVVGDFNALANGETADVTFTYNVVDSSANQANGESNTSQSATVTMTITGTNDAPTVSSIDVVWNEDASVLSLNFLDSAYANDVDASDSLDIQADGRVISAADGEPVVDWTQPDLGIVYTLNGETGAFEIDPSQFNYLQVGDSLEFTLSFNVVDSQGATATNSATFSVEGRQDGAVISVESYDSGVLTTPTDLQEGHDVSGVVYDANGDATHMHTDTIHRSEFTMNDADSASVVMNGTLADFDRNPNYNDAFEVTLKAGESLDVSVDAGNTFSVHDSNGNLVNDLTALTAGNYVVAVHTTSDGVNSANSTYALTIGINGITDASDFLHVTDETGESPENYLILDDAGNALSSKAIEVDRSEFSVLDDDTISHIIAGNLGAAQTAPNYNDAFSFSLQDGEVAHFNFVENTNSEYALFMFDESARTWVSVDDANEEGEYIVRLESDDDTQAGTYQLQINIDASDANYTDAGDVIEDNTADASGRLRVEDADMSEDHFQADTLNTQYGAFAIDENGNWSYTIDDTNPAINTLAAGAVVTDTFAVHSADGTSHDINVTITGTNDLPIIDLGGTDNSILSFVEETAGYDNIFGVYVVDSEGNPSDPRVIISNTNDGYTLGDVLAELDVSVNELEFFLVANGENVYGDISNGLAFDNSGKLISGTTELNNVYYSEGDKNWDGEDHVLQQVNPDGSFDVLFEDLPHLGDQDFHDLVVHVDVNENNNYEATFVEDQTIEDGSTVAGSGAVNIAGNGLLITDVDNDTLFSATVEITNPHRDDVLSFDDSLFSGTVTQEETYLRFDGEMSIADYEALIASVTYESTSENPSDDVRNIEVAVYDEEGNGLATSTLHVTPKNDAPDASNDTYVDATLNGTETAGAAAGIEVTGLYYKGSDVNILDSIDDALFTTKGHYYFEHSSLGHTGYNYMGDASSTTNDPNNSNWFAEHGINISDLRDGVIEFADGTQGIIDTASNGVQKDRVPTDNSNIDHIDYTESAYIYYNANDDISFETNNVEENGALLSINVLSNDFDVDGDALHVTLGNVEASNNQDYSDNVSLNGSNVVFDVQNDFDYLAVGSTETIEIKYHVSDGEFSDMAVATVVVTGTNDGPVAHSEGITNDSANVLHDTTIAKEFDFGLANAGKEIIVSFDMLAYDHVQSGGWEATGPYEDAFNIISNGVHIVDQFGDGAQSDINRDYSFSTTLDNEGKLVLSFESDTTGLHEHADVSNLTVGFSNEENSVMYFNVLANDTDIDGDALTFTITSQSGNGVAEVDNNLLKFTPGSDFDYLAVGDTATVEVAYEISDGHGGTDNAKAVIVVTGTNDAPVAVLDANSGVVYGETFSESFEDNTLSGNQWTIVQQYGQWTMTNGMELQSGNVGGSTASDGDTHTELNTDVPTTLSHVISSIEGEDYTISLDYKPRPGNSASEASDMKVSFGTQEFTILSDANGNITLPVGVTMSDAGNGWNTLTFDVTASSDNAVLALESLTSGSLGAYVDNIHVVGTFVADLDTDENASIIIDVLANDYDVDSDAITLTNVSNIDGEGSVSIVNNMLSFDPGSDFDYLGNGDSVDIDVTYTISDGDLSDSATATIHVTGTDDLPQIVLTNIIYNHNEVQDGSFENPDVTGNFDTLSAGASAGAWHIDSGSIDLIDGYWPASEGDQSVDLSGNNAATISQSFATVVGATYTVTFDLSANGDTNKTVGLNVSAADDSSTFTYDGTTSNRTDMNWNQESFTFVATDSVSTLSFESLEHDAYGPALDNVQVHMNYNGNEFVVLEDGSLSISGIAISDVDGIFNAVTGQYEVALDSDNGVVNPSTVTGTTIEDVNAQLQDITFTPAQDFNGSTAINISLTDGSAVLNGSVTIPSDSASINVDVTPVNDAPTAQGDSADILEGNATFNSIADVFGNDVDGDALTYSFADPAWNNYLNIDSSNGVVSLNQAGVDYVNGEFLGDATFDVEVVVSDGQADASAVVSINIYDGDVISQVYEANLASGTVSSIDPTTVGNLLESDYYSDTSVITSVNGVAAVNGVITLTDTMGTLEVNVNSGSYLYTLSNNALSSSDVVLDFDYEVDTDSIVTDAQLHVTVVDDAPVSDNVHTYVAAQSSNDDYVTNLTIMLDESGSIGAANFSTLTGNVVSLVQKYQELGAVNVNLVTFASTVSSTHLIESNIGAQGVIDAIANNAYDRGATHTKDALTTVMATPIAEQADAEVVYFFSDGTPYPYSQNIDSTTANAWNLYISDNVDQMVSVGIGSNINTDILNQIATSDGTTLSLTDFTSFDSVFESVPDIVISGEISIEGEGEAPVLIGADGGHITSIQLLNSDGTNYGDEIVYDSTNPEQTITTQLGGSITVDFNLGTYTYTNPNGLSDDIDTLAVSVEDNDGDTATGTLNIHLNDGSTTTTYVSGNIVNADDNGTDTLVISDTLDLSNIGDIHNIEVIELDTNADILGNITAADVVDMTDDNNTLIITSTDGDDAAHDVHVDTTSLTLDTTAGVDGFNVYSDGTATIQIQTVIDDTTV